MKIKYIKENFFDDNDIDDLSAEETVAQEQADLIFSKFTDIFPDILAKTTLRSTAYRIRSCCIYFPVPHEMPYKTRSPYHKIRIIGIDLVETERLVFTTRVNNGVYTSPTSHDELKVSASYNAKTNDLTVNLDWLPESMTRTLLVRLNAPILSNYSYNALISTAYILNMFTSAIKSLVNDKFKININTLTINILVNSKFLIKLSDNGDGSSVYNDYFNFVTAVTGRTLEHFNKICQKYRNIAFSRNSFKKTELECILPKSTFKPDSRIGTDTYYSYYQTD